MAQNDIKVGVGSISTMPPTVTWQTEAGATAILPGEPVKLKVAGSPYVIPVADNEPVVGTTTAVVGIAQSASTHTASADGTIEVYVPVPGVKYGAKATTAANFNTQSEVNALCGDRVTFDLVSGTYTVNEDEGDASDHGLMIVGGNPDTQEVHFIIRSSATLLD